MIIDNKSEERFPTTAFGFQIIAFNLPLPKLLEKVRKMTFRWNAQKERELISLVQDCELIWNKTLEERKNPNVMADMWDSIANQLKISKDKVRNKWKALCTQYYKEVGKKKTSKSKKTWSHLEAMSFIKDQVCDDPSGNMDFMSEMDDDSEESLQLQRKENSKPESTQFLSSSTPGPSSLEVNNRKRESDWYFLMSTLSDINLIEGDDTKFQFRVEAFFMLFNFATHNKLYRNANQVKSCESNECVQVKPSVSQSHEGKISASKKCDKLQSPLSKSHEDKPSVSKKCDKLQSPVSKSHEGKPLVSKKCDKLQPPVSKSYEDEPSASKKCDKVQSSVSKSYEDKPSASKKCDKCQSSTSHSRQGKSQDNDSIKDGKNKIKIEIKDEVFDEDEIIFVEEHKYPADVKPSTKILTLLKNPFVLKK